jgi:hypothetical protein
MTEVVEVKTVSMKVEDGKLIIAVDPNKNGTPLMKLSVDIAEVPAEVAAAFKKD